MKIVKINKMLCSVKFKKKNLNRLKNGLNKKIYEKLNDERGRKKILMWILLLLGIVYYKK